MLGLAKKLQVLQKSTLLKGLDDETLIAIAKEQKWMSCEKGSNLFYEGENAQHLYLIIEGRFKLTRMTADGNQVILRILGPGQSIAAVSVLEKSAYPATSTALEKSITLKIERKCLDHLINTHAVFSKNVNKILLARIQELQDRFCELSTEKVEQRISAALNRLASQNQKPTHEGLLVDLSLSRQDLAQLAGTTIYTISRTLKLWEKKKLITVRGRQLIFHSPLPFNPS